MKLDSKQAVKKVFSKSGRSIFLVYRNSQRFIDMLQSRNSQKASLKNRKAGSLTGFGQNNIKYNLLPNIQISFMTLTLKTYAQNYNATSYTGGSFQSLFIEKLKFIFQVKYFQISVHQMSDTRANKIVENSIVDCVKCIFAFQPF